MSAAADARQRTLSRLKREVAYYCGVVARTNSRERIHNADVIIRRRERQLKEARDTAVRFGATDD